MDYHNMRNGFLDMNRKTAPSVLRIAARAQIEMLRSF